MVIVEGLFLLIAGFALLVLSGDKLVETSVRIARRWNIPPSVIAATIIAAGTSAPELVTSFLAGMKGNADISIGNVIGSNSTNLLVIGGLSLMIAPKNSVSRLFPSWLVLTGACALLYYVLLDLFISSQEGLLLTFTLLVFVFVSFLGDKEEPDIPIVETKSLSRTLIFFCISFIGLIIGAELALMGGVQLGQWAGLSERVIAITIISIGTSLPELVTSVSAALKGYNDIALGNILGSNIFNALAIPGLTATFYPLTIDQQFMNLDFYVMIGATGLMGILFLINRSSLKRGLGLVMIMAYHVYVLKILLDT